MVVKKILKATVCNILAILMVLALVAIPTSAATIKLNYTNISLTRGYSTTLKVSGTTSKATWSTSDSTIATVSTAGKVVGKKAGTVYITAKVGSQKLSCKVNVVYGRLYTSDSKVELETGDSEFVTITAKGSHALVVSSSNKNVAKATWEGSFNGNEIDLQIKAISSGTAKIKVYFKGYSSIYKYIYVTVDGAKDDDKAQGSVSISTSTATVAPTATTVVQAYSVMANSLAVKSADTSIATATIGTWTNGLMNIQIAGVKEGKTTIRVYRTDNTKIYSDISVTVSGSSNYYKVVATAPSKSVSTDSVIEYQLNSSYKKYMLVPQGYDIAYVNTLFAVNTNVYDYYKLYSASPTTKATGDVVKYFNGYINGAYSTRYVLLPATYDEVKYNTLVADYTKSYEYYTIYNTSPTKKYFSDIIMNWTIINPENNSTMTRYILLPYNYDTTKYDTIVNADKASSGYGSYYQIYTSYPTTTIKSTDKVIYKIDTSTLKTYYMIVPTDLTNTSDILTRNKFISNFLGRASYYAIYSFSPTKINADDTIRPLLTSDGVSVYMLVPAVPDETKAAQGLAGTYFAV